MKSRRSLLAGVVALIAALARPFPTTLAQVVGFCALAAAAAVCFTLAVVQARRGT